MLNLASCYKYFNVDKNATKQEIQRIYKEKAKLLHPDLNFDKNTTQEFQELNDYFQYIKTHHSNNKDSDEEWFDIDLLESYGFKLGGFLQKIDIRKYNTDVNNLTCVCPDWKLKRSFYSIDDPRRLCKHIIASFQIINTKNAISFNHNNKKVFANRFNSKLLLPNSLKIYSSKIFYCYDNKCGFNLYENENIYFGEEIVVLYKIKKPNKSIITIYLKYDYEISLRAEQLINSITGEVYDFISESKCMFFKFCTKKALLEINEFLKSFSFWDDLLNYINENYYSDYERFGRKIITNDDFWESDKKNYLLSRNYRDNIEQLFSYNYCEYIIDYDEFIKIKESFLNHYSELKNLIKDFNINISTREFNFILQKMGVIKKIKEYNLNNWIISKEFNEYGINLVKEYSPYLHEKIPFWYGVHYFNINSFELKELEEREHIACTTLLFRKDIFLSLYEEVLNYQKTMELNKVEIKGIKSYKQLERETWLKDISCPYCESKNIHKKDIRKRKTFSVQRYQCVDCKKIFQKELDNS